ncbi:MAG: hypothetical protein GY832_18045 [Chloroflexi bacterium]|nr:hypothetical protein [Chloroflexota bacterium]
MVKTIHYRVGQFIQALTARVPEKDVEQAVRVLTPTAQALFRRQAIQDQHHALAVYHTLRQAGHTNPQLLAAALLHDVGKSAARLPAWQRAIIVLVERFAPRLLARLSQKEPEERGQDLTNNWRHPFIVHAQHPEIGAQWALEAGCAPLTVALIRRHQDKLASHLPLTNNDVERENNTEDQLLAALQAADNLH